MKRNFVWSLCLVVALTSMPSFADDSTSGSVGGVGVVQRTSTRDTTAGVGVDGSFHYSEITADPFPSETHSGIWVDGSGNVGTSGLNAGSLFGSGEISAAIFVNQGSEQENWASYPKGGLTEITPGKPVIVGHARAGSLPGTGGGQVGLGAGVSNSYGYTAIRGTMGMHFPTVRDSMTASEKRVGIPRTGLQLNADERLSRGARLTASAEAGLTYNEAGPATTERNLDADGLGKYLRLAAGAQIKVGQRGYLKGELSYDRSAYKVTDTGAVLLPSKYNVTSSELTGLVSAGAAF